MADYDEYISSVYAGGSGWKPAAIHKLERNVRALGSGPGELAVLIGQDRCSIDQAQAMTYVAGYACYHDATLRDGQRHTHQFTPGKNFPATGGFGPWMVTPDGLGDATALTLTTRLNGQEMQRSTNEMALVQGECD